MKAEEHGWNPDDFEKQLARVPMKPAPAEWRTEILANARLAAAEVSGAQPSPSQDAREKGSSWLDTLLRLPLGWAGLAAAWGFALSAGNVDRWLNGGSARPWVTVPTGQIAHAQIERAELLKLDGGGEGDPDARESRRDRKEPQSSPRPRSQRHRDSVEPLGFRAISDHRAWLV